MLRFRESASSALLEAVTRESVRALVAEMVRPAHFFVGPDLALKWEHVASEELVWEIFQGRLLDPATRASAVRSRRGTSFKPLAA